MLQPAPVTVRCAVGVVWPPISRGLRYCLSAVEKWLVAMQATLPAYPPSMSILPMRSDSAMVEQAPYRPKNGNFSSLAAKFAEIIWFRRSPPSRQSTPPLWRFTLSIAPLTVCSNILRSAFSQLSSPQVSSLSTISKYGPSGPLPSIGPTTVAELIIAGGLENSTVCLPARFTGIILFSISAMRPPI